MQKITETVEVLANLLIRPQRASYRENQLIGGVERKFHVKGKVCARVDFVIPNDYGHELQCSLYLQGQFLEDAKGKNCVIYLHGNCGCRLDANEVVALLLPEDICVCCFDFSGSGLSGGEYITLGAREPHDLKFIVTFLRTLGIVQVGLWGRSMGAVTALRYLHKERDLTIAGILADSPFTTLVELVYHLTSDKIFLPKLAINIALHYINKIVESKAKFSIREVDTLESAKECFVPALLAHGKDDRLIPTAHSERILEEYAGDCKLLLVSGDHNDLRPLHFKKAARWFFKELLKGGIKTPEDLFAGIAASSPQDDGSAS